MSISLDRLTQILAKIEISSSLEEEILTTAKDVITPPDANKEELTFEELEIEGRKKGSRVIKIKKNIMQTKIASHNVFM